MDPQFRSSFIPKKPLQAGQGGSSKRRRSFSLFSFVGATLFVVALLASGAVFIYGLATEQQIERKGLQLTEIRDNLDLERINDFRALDARLNTAQALLREHKAMAQFFSMLEERTLHNVQFNSFAFVINPIGETYDIELGGEAVDFNALSLQADVFERESMLLGTEFINIAVTESGNVAFEMLGVIDPSAIRYEQ